MIHLTEPELRKILAEQIVGLLKVQTNECVPLHHLMSAFTCHFGFNIPLHDFGVDCEEELLSKLKHVVKVSQLLQEIWSYKKKNPHATNVITFSKSLVFTLQYFVYWDCTFVTILFNLKNWDSSVMMRHVPM